MATPLTKFQSLVLKLGQGVYNLGTDTLKVAFSDVAPNAATNTVFADITEIAAGNGYAAGGAAIAGQTFTDTAGVASLVGADVIVTAAGGTIGPFRYIIFYDFTGVGKPLIGYGDTGVENTIPDGGGYLIHWDPTAIMTIQ